ncbi:helix-turn-helix domain-containing protein [Labilibaculum sp. DW002]|uniref:Helix-turn-helix domain-containing protein n=1 Tax=Paralabilibaculum antarcticum TaxID=2912572 RepID=A0ABT5VNM6_9BACT|nr:helix-turn-helix domain-containing protein [Labilibaculum sp. DW002]MDE5416850.1 helix-turn-helix domain-containing protein [Labilibaculum sp. DW002]
MPDQSSSENDFLLKITTIIQENISNEKFGVSELADEVGMSRSNLLRKIKKINNLSVSQFIREVRLKYAMELLQDTDLSVSEISYKVGFSSVSYFIKCFRDHYGYPPGEATKQENKVDDSYWLEPKKGNKRKLILAVFFILILISVFGYVFLKPVKQEPLGLEKSIAVLPFKNDSNDSTNVYLINGLMESILTKLQQIEDVRVISRTSVEKYRNNAKSSAEIAEELNVSYFVEGSGQKIGDQIQLTVQLIEAPTDKHLWAEQYNKKTKDIFALQQDVAKNIASEIKAIITPEEEEQINKVPTENLLAYDYFLKGMEFFHRGSREGLEQSIIYFQKAVAEDPEFAQAYADIAMAYYYLDIAKAQKNHTSIINENADKALLLDGKLPQSLLAKALYYMNIREYDKALPYLEKALHYNPNSALAINFLSDYYTTYMPNTEKYLEYALRGIGLDIAAQDSVTASYVYLHVSNALVQSGFIEESLFYINKSTDYNPKNLFSEYLKAYILYAKNEDLIKTKNLLVAAFEKDTTRLDILQEVGKMYYYIRDYETSYAYYKHFVAARENYKLSIYPHEDIKIALVMEKTGRKAEAEKLFANYFEYATNDKSIYKNASLAVYFAHKGEVEKALEHLDLFSKEDNYQFWLLLFLEIDPLVDNLKDHPDFKKIVKKINNKFWKGHKEIKKSLKKKELID